MAATIAVEPLACASSSCASAQSRSESPFTTMLARHTERQIAARAQVSDVRRGQATGPVSRVGARGDTRCQFAYALNIKASLGGECHTEVPFRWDTAPRL